jgi:hypothetical protein
VSAAVDEAPLKVGGGEMTCKDCGTTFDYSGRGPKTNRRCSDCAATANAASKHKAATLRPPAKLGKQIADMYAMGAMGLMLVDPVCATALAQSAESCGMAWEQAAKESPAIRRVLTRLVATSVAGQLVAAHVPIILAVAQHHGGAALGKPPVAAAPDGPQ